MFKYLYSGSEISIDFFNVLQGVDQVGNFTVDHTSSTSIVNYDENLKIIVDKEKIMFYSKYELSEYDMLLIILQINSDIVSNFYQTG